MTEESDLPETDDVRRLLAEARHTTPIPADVAARMDAVLADLAGSSGDGTPSADPEVVSLAAHRRRRAAGLLVAAAAIVVGGVAVAQQLPQHSNSGVGTAAGGVPADSSRTPGYSAHGEKSPGPLSPSSAPAHLRQGRIVVRPQQFSADALAGQALMHTKFAYRANDVSGSSSCIVAPPHSRLLAAVFRHAPAVLVYHRPAGSTQVVDLFVCGSTEPLRSITLPSD